MKEMASKLSKLKHSAIGLDLELNKIKQMRSEMAPTPAHDTLKSKPYTWPLVCTKLQNEQTKLAHCKIRPCGHAHVDHLSTQHILQ
ncbi:hypothetical protein KC19_7G099600 [Ceratodon purpureus]|uniref:Uncharacterized protein n=1 Tax=Ceratodon purpureus TaxID=3225 RepID=A0A8T0H9G7_CERPU|nr:hypothetical protein KC19_7G099600 [Ceratodon purpureus]